MTDISSPANSPDAFFCPQTKNLILWSRHIKEKFNASFEERSKFLMENPGLPLQKKLQRLAELSLTESTPTDFVRNFFQTKAPETSKGSFVWASLLMNDGKVDDARDEAKRVWQTMEFTPQGQSLFLGKFKEALDEADHKKRVDFFFIQKKYDQIQSLMPLLSSKLKSLAHARLSIALKKQSMSNDLALVASEYQEDAGLIFERVKYLNAIEDYDESFVLASKMKPRAPYEAEDFFKQRARLAREALKKFKFDLAFDIAQDHGIENTPQTQKTLSSALELAGWIALTHMRESAKALEYFSKKFEVSKTKFDQSKAAFYASLCEAQMNNPESQRLWLEKAADVPGSFYGQLALGQLQKPFPDFMPISGSSTRVETHPLIGYAKLLCFFEQFDHAILFFEQALKDFKSIEDYIHFANLITKNLPIHHRVYLFKILKKDQSLLFKEAYPIPDYTHELESKNLSVFLSLILQESNFNEKALSPAGAIGISQLMPKTAKETAGQMKIPYVAKNLMKAAYNAKIGNYHFNELFDSFSSSLILSTASYNAGKAKVLEWIQTYGDPRSPGTNKLTFIQNISYPETRGYVEFILGNYGVYKRLLDQKKAKKKKI